MPVCFIQPQKERHAAVTQNHQDKFAVDARHFLAVDGDVRRQAARIFGSGSMIAVP